MTDAVNDEKFNGLFTSVKKMKREHLCLAIAGEDFPATRLSEDFADELQESLACAIDALPEEGSLPRFDEFRHTEQGIIMVTCFDEGSKEWLTTTLREMAPLKGTSLQVLEGEAIPRLRKMVAFVPGAPVNRDNILQRIERSTPELNTGLWQIQDIVTVPLEGTRVILWIDEPSAESLQRINFVGHAGMSMVSFWEPRLEGDLGAGGSPGASASQEAEDQELPYS